MIDWKQKLSSRKLWLALIGFVTAILYAFNFAQADVEKVASVIMAGSTLIVYILSEAHVDANRQEVIILDEEDLEEVE
jgi:hypothetical protein